MVKERLLIFPNHLRALFLTPTAQSARDYHISSVGMKPLVLGISQHRNPGFGQSLPSSTGCCPSAAIPLFFPSLWMSPAAAQRCQSGVGTILGSLTHALCCACGVLVFHSRILKCLTLAGNTANKPRGFKGPRTRCSSAGSAAKS